MFYSIFCFFCPALEQSLRSQHEIPYRYIYLCSQIKTLILPKLYKI